VPAPLAPSSGGLDAAAVRRAWNDVLGAVKLRKRTTMVLLSAHATVASVDGDTLVLGITSAPLAKRLAEEVNTTALREALREVLGVDWRVVTQVAAASPGGGSAAGQSPPVFGSGSPVAPGAEAVPASRAAPPVPGFAPGDEAADEEDDGDQDRGSGDRASRPSAEESAISLLTASLGARAIDARPER